MKRKVSACDWDGTLADPSTGEWLPGARGMLQQLLRDYTVVITRAVRPQSSPHPPSAAHSAAAVAGLSKSPARP